MKIFIASDHNGHKLRKEIVDNLKEYEFVSSTLEESATDDYPLFAFDICRKMDKNEDYAVLICGTGIGISMAANKVKGVRCAKVNSLDEVVLAKQHNHANAIAFSAKTALHDAISYINALVNTATDDSERHVRRVNEIIKYEEGAYNEL